MMGRGTFSPQTDIFFSFSASKLRFAGGGGAMEALRARGRRLRALIRRRRREERDRRDGKNERSARPDSRAKAVHVGEIYGFVGAITTSVFAGKGARELRARGQARADPDTQTCALHRHSCLFLLGLHAGEGPARARDPLLPIEVSSRLLRSGGPIPPSPSDSNLPSLSLSLSLFLSAAARSVRLADLPPRASLRRPGTGPSPSRCG